MTHDEFVASALRHFGAKVLRAYTYEKARDDVLALLREANNHLPAPERWIRAASVFNDLWLLNQGLEPQQTWAARAIDETLTPMVSKLHQLGLPASYTSAWRHTWPYQKER